MKKIIFKHWTEGGTGVTNFELSQLDFYKKVVKEFGDSELVVVDKAFKTESGYTPCGYGLLHNLRDTGKIDLSDFWALFYLLKKGNSKPI